MLMIVLYYEAFLSIDTIVVMLFPFLCYDSNN